MIRLPKLESFKLVLKDEEVEKNAGEMLDRVVGEFERIEKDMKTPRDRLPTISVSRWKWREEYLPSVKGY